MSKEEKPSLRELVDFNELQSIQDSFAKTVGTSSVIFSPEGEPLTQFSNPTGFCSLIQSTEKGKRRCFISFTEMCRTSLELKEPGILYCFAHGGHFVAPIIIDGEHKGTMFAGQFIPQKFSTERLKELEKTAREINVDPQLLVGEAKKMRVVEEDKVWNYSSLLFQIVELIASLGAQAAELNLAKDTLQKAHDELEKRVQERTADLVKVNEQLKREITERKQAEKRALRQSALLEAINKVFLETLTCKTDEEVAHTCLAVAEELTDSKFGFIGEVNRTGRFDTIALSDPGWDSCKMSRSDAVVMIKDLEIRGIWGRVLKDEQSHIFNDPPSHPDRVGTPEGHPSLTSFLGVPLKHAGRTIGMIALANKESDYDPADQQAVETLSVAFVEALNRKRAEEKLRLFSQAVNSSVEGVAMGNLDNRITYVNEAFVRMFGYSREELIGREIAFIYPEDQLPKLKTAFKATMEGCWTGELDARRKDGERFPIAVSSSLIKDDEGKVIAHMASHQDVTDRKRAEEEQRKNMAELERFNRFAVGRELKMVELKKEINALLEQSGKERRYRIAGEKG